MKLFPSLNHSKSRSRRRALGVTCSEVMSMSPASAHVFLCPPSIIRLRPLRSRVRGLALNCHLTKMFPSDHAAARSFADRPHSSSSQPLGLTQVVLESSSLRLETPLSSLDETLFPPASSPEASKCHSPHSSPSQRPPELVQDDSLSDSLEDSLTIHAHPHSMPPHRQPRITQDDSVPITLGVALTLTSPAVLSIPQQRLLPSLGEQCSLVDTSISSPIRFAPATFIFV
jgi:hypothetical protein